MIYHVSLKELSFPPFILAFLNIFNGGKHQGDVRGNQSRTNDKKERGIIISTSTTLLHYYGLFYLLQKKQVGNICCISQVGVITRLTCPFWKGSAGSLFLTRLPSLYTFHVPVELSQVITIWCHLSSFAATFVEAFSPFTQMLNPL